MGGVADTIGGAPVVTEIIGVMPIAVVSSLIAKYPYIPYMSQDLCLLMQQSIAEGASLVHMAQHLDFDMGDEDGVHFDQ